jgi:hypothetical protein
MKVQDLSKELSDEERAVRGGSNANIGFIGGPELAQSGGPSLFSPSTAVVVDTPTQIQTNVAPVTTTLDSLNTANVVGSLGTLIGQK